MFGDLIIFLHLKIHGDLIGLVTLGPLRQLKPV